MDNLLALSQSASSLYLSLQASRPIETSHAVDSILNPAVVLAKPVRSSSLSNYLLIILNPDLPRLQFSAAELPAACARHIYSIAIWVS